MRIVVMTVVAWLGLIVAGDAQTWRITLDGEGPPPTGSILVTPAPPIIPPGPPAPPPLPSPPVVPPIVDTSPFIFPAQQPGYGHNDPSARYTGGVCPLVEWDCYAALAEYTSPTSAHLFACYLPPGMRFRGASLGGLRLWVPSGMAPVQIRTLCAGGAL